MVESFRWKVESERNAIYVKSFVVDGIFTKSIFVTLSEFCQIFTRKVEQKDASDNPHQIS